MFLSDRDLRWAIECGHLIVSPGPERTAPTSIDLHLDEISSARIWDTQKYENDNRAARRGRAELPIGTFDFRSFSGKYLKKPPRAADSDPADRVFLKGRQVVIRPLGFLLWRTKERVGTPEKNAELICFIEGKSTRARMGLVIHLTAPIIHSTWFGKIALEIVNLGPFDIVLEEDDAIAQITVARITSVPDLTMRMAGSVTLGQTSLMGAGRSTGPKRRKPIR